METGMQNAIEQMKQKEESGLQYLYSKTYNFVYLRLKSMLKNEDTIREIMQKVYSQAYESAEDLNEDKIYEWLGNTVYILGSQAAKKRKEREASFIEMEEIEVQSDDKGDLEKSAEVICGALDELPELYQATAFAFYYDQASVKKIATMMGCSAGVVRNRLNYARKYMIKVLQECQEEEDQKAKEKVPVQELEVEEKVEQPEEAVEDTAEDTAEDTIPVEAEERSQEMAEAEAETEEDTEEETVESEEEEIAEEETGESEAETEETVVEEIEELETEAEETTEEETEDTEEETEEAETEEAAEEEAVEPVRKFVKIKEPKPKKVAFTVEAFCMAVGKWADEHSLSLNIAHKVGRDVCKAENLNPDLIVLAEEEPAGADKAIISYEMGSTRIVEEELRYNQRKKKIKVKGVEIEGVNEKESIFSLINFDKRIVIGIAAGLIAVVGIAAGVVMWNNQKEPPVTVVEKEKEKPKKKPQKEEETPIVETPTEEQQPVETPESDRNQEAVLGDSVSNSGSSWSGNEGQGSAGQSGSKNNSNSGNSNTGSSSSGSGSSGSGSSGSGSSGSSGSGNGGSTDNSGTETPDDAQYYVFPKSNTELLAEEEVRKLTKEQLRIARNEIYARYGMKFRTPELAEYFSKLPWYKPLYWAEEFYEKIKLTMVEEKNVALILRIEKELQ